MIASKPSQGFPPEAHDEQGRSGSQAGESGRIATFPPGSGLKSTGMREPASVRAQIIREPQDRQRETVRLTTHPRSPGEILRPGARPCRRAH